MPSKLITISIGIFMLVISFHIWSKIKLRHYPNKYMINAISLLICGLCLICMGIAQ